MLDLKNRSHSLEEVIFHLPHCTEPKEDGHKSGCAIPRFTQGWCSWVLVWASWAFLGCWLYSSPCIHLPAYPQGKHLARNVSRFRDGQSPPPPTPSPRYLLLQSVLVCITITQPVLQELREFILGVIEKFISCCSQLLGRQCWRLGNTP